MAIIKKDGIEGKECSCCRTWKPLDDYYDNAGHPPSQGGKHCTCKECTAKKGKAKRSEERKKKAKGK